jgi:hypothetical protein
MRSYEIALAVFALWAVAFMAWADSDPDTYTLLSSCAADTGGTLVALDSCSVVVVPDLAAFTPKTAVFSAPGICQPLPFTITGLIPDIQGGVTVHEGTCENSGGVSGFSNSATSNFPVLAPAAPVLSE